MTNETSTRKKIYCVGGSGLVGSRIVELLSSSFDFTIISREKGFDITKPETLTSLSLDTRHEFVIHLAAKTDVDGCESEKNQGEKGEAWKINVLGTQNVVNFCLKTKKKLIYFSTDFVFDGTKQDYTEEDLPNPINWYSKTKYEGEKLIQKSGLPFIIVRIAYPYKASKDNKMGFIGSIFTRLKKGEKVEAIIDQTITPTFIDDIAFALDKLIEQKVTGIYHVVGSQFITPYDAIISIAKMFEFDSSLVMKTTREKFFKGRASRPFNLSLKNDKIEGLGIKMKTFEEGLKEIRKLNY